jgi:hypothetical protein
MAERNQKVFERVRQELGDNPDLGSRELYQLAQQVDKTTAQDSLQQFHARYVLPVKRELRGAGGGAKETKRTRATSKVKTPRKPASEKAERRPPARKAADAATPSAPPASDRDRVRALLLQFAQELTDAESRSSLVKVLGRVDSYVDRIAPAGR